MGVLKAATAVALAAGIAAALHAAAQEYSPPRLFEAAHIPDMTGKVVVVTGGNTGIGLETVYQIARRGAKVVLASRSTSRGEQALATLRDRESAQLDVDVLALDLSSLASVQSFAQEVERRYERVDVLVANAGIMLTPFELSADGIESQFAVNHVGHFFLVNLLLPKLRASAAGRIVVVASRAHEFPYSTGIVFDRINDPDHYSPVYAYGQSKLSNILFSNELARRLGDTQIRVNSLHPGSINTELFRNIEASMGWVVNRVVDFVRHRLFLSVPDGALTQLFLATSPKVETDDIRGKYFVPIASEGTPSAFGRDAELGRRLWQFTEELLAAKGFALRPW